MIHSGSVIAAGISQGRSTSLKRDFKVSPLSAQGHTPGRACGTHTDEKPKALVSTPEKTSMAMANDSHRNTRLACEVSVRNLRLMAPSWETRGH